LGLVKTARTAGIVVAAPMSKSILDQLARRLPHCPPDLRLNIRGAANHVHIIRDVVGVDLRALIADVQRLPASVLSPIALSQKATHK
jgi:hypothetical protein